MAKLKNPLLSFLAQGKLGDITLLRRRRINVAEKTPVVPDQKTPAQLSWRHMYQKCAALWHTLSVAEQQDWESLARPKHMTGFAFWQSQCLRPNPGIYLPLQGGSMQGDIDMAKNRVLKLPLPSDSQEPLTLAYHTANIAPYLYHEGARVYHNVGQDIPNAAWTTLAFGTERYDTDSIHDNVTNNSRLTCKTAGKYFIAFNFYWPINPTGLREAAIRVNGVTRICLSGLTPNATTHPAHVLATIYPLAVNDYVEARAYQSSGIALTIASSAQYSPEFMMERIGT